MQKIKKERNSSLELLCIISMLFIVAAHFSVHNKYPAATLDTFSINNIILQVLGSYAYVGVEAFMLITGYFMVTSQRSNYRKAVKMVADILFYSVVLLAVCAVFKLFPLTSTDILGSLSPWGYYWFVTNYIIILLISPYLNQLLLRLDKKQYLILLIILLFATRFIPIVLAGHFSVTTGTIDYYLIFYMIGGYIRQYVPFSNHNYRNFIVFVSMFLLVAVIAVVVDYIGLRTGKDELLGVIHYMGLDSIPVDICTIALFLFFRNKNIQSKHINSIARNTLDVYLIHENRLIMKVLWGGYFLDTFLHSRWFAVFAILEIFAVYVGCTMIGWCKQRTWDVFFGTILDKFENRYKLNRYKLNSK